MKIISFETDNHNNVERKLLKSCDINNINITIFGKETKWDGFITKFYITLDYLNTIDDELICLTDSRDVLYLSTAEMITKTFLENFNKNMVVFNGETNCFPDLTFSELHPQQERKYKYLNSGCMIGNRKNLIKIFEEALLVYEKTKVNDDQYLLQSVFLSNKFKDIMTLDYDCKIFQCMWDEDFGRSNNFDIIYTKNEIYNRLTKTTPLIFHFPGPTTTDSQVWKILNNRYYSINETFF